MAPPHHPGDVRPRLSRRRPKGRYRGVWTCSTSPKSCCRSPCPRSDACSGRWSARGHHRRAPSCTGRTGDGSISNVPGALIGTDEHSARRVKPGCSTTAYRRLVGTGIATVLEEGSGILGGDAVERGSKCLFQSLDGACGDPAEVGFHLGPAWLDRAEVRAVAGQIAIRKA